MLSNPTGKDLEISWCLEKPLRTHYSFNAFGRYLQESSFWGIFQLIMYCISVQPAVSCWLYWKLQAQSKYSSPSHPPGSSFSFKKKRHCYSGLSLEIYSKVYISSQCTVNLIIKAEKWQTTDFPSLACSWFKSVNLRWWQKCDQVCTMWTSLSN